jgi:hypothetical protein
MPQWTKTPPAEPGWYWVAPGRHGGDVLLARLRIGAKSGRWWHCASADWSRDDSDFAWFWSEPIEFPPSPPNTNAPDQAGA